VNWVARSGGQHEMRVARVEPVGDAPAGPLEHGTLTPGRPLAAVCVIPRELAVSSTSRLPSASGSPMMASPHRYAVEAGEAAHQAPKDRAPLGGLESR
jgi:hypothetical protein